MTNIIIVVCVLDWTIKVQIPARAKIFFELSAAHSKLSNIATRTPTVFIVSGKSKRGRRDNRDRAFLAIYCAEVKKLMSIALMGVFSSSGFKTPTESVSVILGGTWNDQINCKGNLIYLHWETIRTFLMHKRRWATLIMAEFRCH